MGLEEPIARRERLLQVARSHGAMPAALHPLLRGPNPGGGPAPVKDDRPHLIPQALERVEEAGPRGRQAFLAEWLLQDATRVDLGIVCALIEQRVSALRDDSARPLASFGTQG